MYRTCMRVPTKYTLLLSFALLGVTVSLSSASAQATVGTVNACINKSDRSFVISTKCTKSQTPVTWNTDGTSPNPVSACVNRATMAMTYSVTGSCGSKLLISWTIPGTESSSMTVCVDKKTKKMRYAPTDWCARGSSKLTWVRTRQTTATTTSTSTTTTTVPTGPYIGHQFGGANDEGILSMIVNADGSRFLSGYECSNISTLPVVGGGGTCNAFVSKVSSSNSIQWTRSFGGPNGSSGGLIAGDGGSGVILAWGTMDNAFATTTTNDVVLSHLDGTGTNDWNWQSALAAEERVGFIRTTASGDMYVSGASDSDVFVMKLHRSNGSIVTDWRSTTGSTSVDQVMDFRVQADGTSYVSGFTLGVMTGSGASAPTSHDGFVVKFAPDGSRSWTRQMHNGSTVDNMTVGVGPTGRLYASSWTSTDPSNSTNTFANPALMLQELNPSTGAVLWSRLLGPRSGQFPFGTLVDEDGNVVVFGYTLSVVGGGIASSGRQAFAIKTDASGSQLWATSTHASGSNAAYVWGYAVDPAGDYYLYGEAINDMGSTNAAPGAGTDDAWYIRMSADGTWEPRHS